MVHTYSSVKKKTRGSEQRRLTGVSLEKTSQNLSFLFGQLLFIKTIYQKHINRAWGQLHTYILLFATTIGKKWWIANQVPREVIPVCLCLDVTKNQSAKTLCDKIPTENRSYQVLTWSFDICNLAIGNNLISRNRRSTRLSKFLVIYIF